MRAIIFGNKNDWEPALELLMEYREDIVPVGLCDPYETDLAKQNDAVMTIDDIEVAYRQGEADAVISVDASIPIWNKYFTSRGIEHNYAIATKYYRKKKIKKNEIQDLIRPYGNIKPELRNLEFQLADHCNLKCKGCTHFSNLVRNPVFPDLKRAEKDFQRLAELFDNIREIHLMGGEPLLNPEVGSFCKIAREAFPYAKIFLVTNGLLLPKMKAPFFQILNETETELSISDYTCLDENRIFQHLKANGVTKAELRNGKQTFYKSLNPKADQNVNDVFARCGRRNCTILYEGMIACCAQPFMIRYFNDYYGTDLSEKGGISIYEEENDGYRILDHLSHPMDACRFCGFEEPYDWEISRDPVPMEDWCVK